MKIKQEPSVNRHARMRTMSRRGTSRPTSTVLMEGKGCTRKMLLALALGSDATTLKLNEHGAAARARALALHTTIPACVATKLQF